MREGNKKRVSMSCETRLQRKYNKRAENPEARLRHVNRDESGVGICNRAENPEARLG